MRGVVHDVRAALRERGAETLHAATPGARRHAAEVQGGRGGQVNRPRSPRKLVRALGAIVAVIAVVSAPLGYGIIGYLKEAQALSYKAELTAKQAAHYIGMPKDAPWLSDSGQLPPISEISTPTAAPMLQRVLDAGGQPVIEKGATLAWPTFTRSAPILANGKSAGIAEVSASLRPLLAEVLLIALCSLLLGVAAYLAFAVLPLRVVDRSFRELEHANALLKEREATLNAQNLVFDAALENMFQGLAMFDAQERIVIANDRFAEMYGLTPDQVKPGTTLARVAELRIANGSYVGLTPEDVVKTMRERVARGRESHLTSRLGNGRIISVSLRPTGDGGWVSTHQDITERENLTAQLAKQNALLQQREEELEAQNARFDAAMRYMSQGLCLFDADQRVVICNDRYLELYGLSAEQAKPGTTLRQIMEARAAMGLYKNFDATAFVDQGVGSFSEEVSELVRLADGRCISVLRRPMPDGGLVSTHQDITERENLTAQLARQNELLQQREEELRAQNARFDAAMRNMSQGLCLYDAQQKVVIANRRFAEIYGLTPEQIKPGTTLRQILEARAAKGLYNNIDAKAFVESGVASFSHEVSDVVRLADGRCISVLRRPMPDGGLVSTHEDVTEREKLSARLERQNELLRQREEELQAWNLRLDAAIENMSQGLCLYDAQQKVVIANRRFAEIYCLSPEHVKPGTTLQQILEARIANGIYAGANPDEYIKERFGALGRASTKIQRLSDGRDIAICHTPMLDGGWVTTHEDVTEREKSQVAARAAERAAGRSPQQHDARTRHVRQRPAAGGLQSALRGDVPADARAGQARDDHARHPGVSPGQRLSQQERPGALRRRSGRGVQQQIDRHSRAGRRAHDQRATPGDDGRRLGGHARGHHRAPEAAGEARAEQQALERAHLETADHHRQLPRRPGLPRSPPAHRILQRKGQEAAGPAGTRSLPMVRPRSRTCSASTRSAGNMVPAMWRSWLRAAWKSSDRRPTGKSMSVCARTAR